MHPQAGLQHDGTTEITSTTTPLLTRPACATFTTARHSLLFPALRVTHHCMQAAAPAAALRVPVAVRSAVNQRPYLSF
jgi:hypothetical protein